MRQWHMLGLIVLPEKAYRTAPHWQPPVVFLVRSVMAVSLVKNKPSIAAGLHV
jgi:hypothetical protein